MPSETKVNHPGRFFHVFHAGDALGPFSFLEIKQKWDEALFDPTTKYWSQGMEEWQPLTKLFDIETGQGEESNQLFFSRILVVDDDPVMREVISSLSIESNLLPLTAENVPAATKLISEHGTDFFECVVTDYQMPEFNGIDLLKFVKSKDDSLTVVLVTTHDDKQIIKQALRAGIYDFIEKPVNQKYFREVLVNSVMNTRKFRKKKRPRYQTLELLGEGGVSKVYKAWDQELKRPVALKRLKKNHKEINPASITEEAIKTACLNHPHIVNVFDCGEDREGAFVVMEILNGSTLDHKVIDDGFDFSQKDLVTLSIQCLDALEAAHLSGLLHRDMKPSNIMLLQIPGGGIHAKLLDFGLSQSIDKNIHPLGQDDSDDGDFIEGSPIYMPPELFLDSGCDARTDLYSLGCSIYFAACKKDAFDGKNLEEVARKHIHHDVEPIHHLRTDYTKPFCDWIMKLIACDMPDRPKSALTAKKALLKIVEI